MNYAICVSGAAAGKTVELDKKLAEQIGQSIAKAGHIVTTGATVGLPYYAARAAKAAGGMSIGFSPASSLREHVFKYRLPIGIYDFINFTGMHYVGRDTHLVLSSDAVITIGGRMGSLHEFTTALESNTICGILTGSQGAADIIKELMQRLEPVNQKNLIYNDDPEELVRLIINRLNNDNKDIDTKALAASWYLDDDKTDEYGRPIKGTSGHSG
ncbi:MAG TPA: hypothetical protein VLF39_01630 [Candidatus Saccharimonadales bacterium]|nr:hypothetical protein [Candidatus Saccharimonadales bacterium]